MPKQPCTAPDARDVDTRRDGRGRDEAERWAAALAMPLHVAFPEIFTTEDVR